MKKQILLFTAALLFCIVSTFAQGGTTGPLTWKINNGTLTISGEGAMPDYYWLTPKPWYDYKDNIHTLVIENGVTKIGFYAFISFSNLTSVSIANTVLSIGESAFQDCKSLPSITFPNGLISIDQVAFYGCSALSSVFISKSVTNIEPSVFSACYSLTSFEVDTESNYYSSENGVLFNKDKTILAHYPTGKSGAYAIPNSVKTIGEAAFSYCINLTSVTIPNSVETIEVSAFAFCTSLTSIIIPNSVAGIELGVFFQCTNLTSIIIPNNVTSIKEFTFHDCTSLTSITIPNSITKIENTAFSNCTSLKLITNLNPVPVNIGYNVFDGVNQSTCTLEVPMNSVAAYKEANIWKNFKIKGIDVGITSPESLQLSVYPNPTTGELHVTRDALHVTNVEVFDIYGKRHASHVTCHENIIDITHLSKGLYFIKLTTENGIFIEKIIKN